MLFRIYSRLIAPLTTSQFTWIEPQALAACKYPRSSAQLSALANEGVVLLVNLHEHPNNKDALQNVGIQELHLPVPDGAPPSSEQLRRAIYEIRGNVAQGKRIAVHCGSGLGRTGTILACYLVANGESAEEAIKKLRLLRPGSIQTASQERAIRKFGSEVVFLSQEDRAQSP